MALGGLRPLTKLGAIGSSSSFTDLEANPEFLGLSTRLPLGALYRDMDFHGGRFSNEQSSPLIYIDKVGVGSGVAGLAATETLDQLESPVQPAETSAGLPGEVLVMVDGESVNYSSLTNFRTNRGGSSFIGSGDRPGGELFATYERVLGSVSGSRTLVGRAFLVRNAPTDIGSTQVSPGDELMMAIVTQVMELSTIPSEAMVLLGTNGSGESISAADLYRIEGHPLIANHVFYDVDPTTIQLPPGKTISQVTAPPFTPVIPLGAANTVYASNGTYNFWTNNPSLVDLSVLDAIDIGTKGSSSIAAYLNFTKYADPTIRQLDADPGVQGQNLRITGQKGTATVSTTSSFKSGFVTIKSGEMTSPTPGWNGGSGSVSIASGDVDANLIGSTGAITIRTGVNSGTGNTGGVTIESGEAQNGSSGDVSLDSGLVTGTSGNGGSVTVRGGSITNASNTAGNGGNAVVQGGSSIASTGAGVGGDVRLIGGVGPASNGIVKVILDSAVQYASFTNLDLILGPATVSGSYGVQFTSGTTTPTISQATGSGAGALLTIRAQTAGGSNNNGGGVNLVSGLGTGSGTTGDIYLSNGTYTNLRVSVSDTESLYFGTNLTELGHFFSSYDYSLVFSSRVTNPKIGQKSTNGAGPTLTIKAADVASVFTGKGGDLRLESGNGLGVNNGGDIILAPGTPGTGTYGNVAFDSSIPTPTITQKDQTNPSTAYNLRIAAQTHTVSAWAGGSLELLGGTGDAGGGDVEISGGTASSTGSGGAVILTSGSGPAFGNILIRPGGFNGLKVDTTGVHVQQGSGTPSYGLTLEAANPIPSALPDGDGGLYVDFATKHLNYISLPAYGIRKISQNITVATFSDRVTSIAATITSGTYVDVAPGWSLSIPVLAGDIIDGDIFCNVAYSGSQAYLRITCDLNSGAQTENFAEIFESNTKAVMPFNFIASVDGTVVITFQGMVSTGTLLTLGLYYPNLLWFRAKQIRP